jgi:hypothetical protein
VARLNPRPAGSRREAPPNQLKYLLILLIILVQIV